MISVVTGALALSIVHALIPNHWIPLVAISNAEKWKRRETLSFTAIVGISHAASTIAIGVIVGLLGHSLSQHYEMLMEIIAPSVLIVLGCGYLLMGYLGTHSHTHSHGYDVASRKSKFAIVATLSVALFFSPCLEIEAYYFTAGTYGWDAILTISLIYFITTVAGMVAMVDLAKRGTQRVDLHFLEDHEKALTGGILLMLGVLALVVPF